MNTKSTTYWTELHTAAKNGDQEAVAQLIRDGAELDAVTKLDWTPLHFAAKYGYLDCCRLLIEAGASTVAPTRLRFFTPIHIAALEGHTDAVRLFLDSGVDINIRTAEGWTPLHAAVEHAHRDTMRFLLECGADPNLAKRPIMATYPLHSAARNGRLDIVQMLVEGGAEVNVRNKSNKTPRDLAEECGFPRLIAFFDHVAQPEPGSTVPTYTEIRERIRHGDLEWIKQWKENGAPCASKYYSSPLMEACIDGQTEIVRYFLEAGAKPNSGGCWTPLYFMLLYKAFKNTDVITTLLDFGADPMVRDVEGFTVADRWKTELPSVPLELLERLESSGMLIEPKLKNTLALRWAVKNRRHEQAESLLSTGIDPNQTHCYDNEIPLHVAIEQSDTEMVRILLKYGAKPNQKNPLGDSMLYDAAETGNLEIVKMLVEAGANVNRKTGAGSPIKAALKNGHENVVDYLIQQGADTESRTTLAFGQRVDSSSTPIFSALESKRPELIRKMIDKDVDLTMIGDYGNTLLHAAVNSGLIEWVRYFIDKGLNLEAKNRWNQTALQLAVNSHQDEIVTLLLEHGASTAPPPMVSSFFYAITLRQNDVLERMLQEDRAAANRFSQDHDGNLYDKMPLVVALEHGNIEAVELLIKYGASITGAKTSSCSEAAWGDSALSYVSRTGMKEMLLRFLREKINVDTKSSPRPALHCAASVEIAQILLDHGANPYLRSNEHLTALECQLQNKNVAALLREAMSREPENKPDWLKNRT